MNGMGSHICPNCQTPNAANEQYCKQCHYNLLNGSTFLGSNVAMPGSGGSGFQGTGLLSPGRMLNNRYHIITRLGQGGMGAVYQATDTRFRARIVAVKELSDALLDLGEKAQAWQDFEQEANLLAGLDHPNLPKVHDRFEDGGKAYLVMDFIEGKTLETVLKEAKGTGRLLDEQRVMDWAIQLCTVLNYLHTHQPPIIFRDMKPSNVMLTSQGKIKLIDFGIARFFKPAAAQDTKKYGSWAYAPKELFWDGRTDARSDIFSLGVTLYELLTGVLPADVTARVVNQQPLISLRQHNAQISPAVDAIVLKALELRPEDRYQSAEEMLRAISALASPSMVSAAPPPEPPVLPLPKQGSSRRRFLIGALAAAGVVAAGGGAYYFGRPFFTPPITLDFLYTTEKDGWIAEAVKLFNETASLFDGRRIQVNLESDGSVRTWKDILNGKQRPVAWSPASSLELNALDVDWQKQNKTGGQPIIHFPDVRSLVASPLVFAIWKDRAEVLWKKYGKIDWPELHSALVLKNGWADIGGPADWGKVNFGHTRPDQSNSGLLTITLMACAYYKLQSGLQAGQINDPGFLAYLEDIEGAVSWSPGHSSGTYLKDVVTITGPASNIVSTYENLVIASEATVVQKWKQPLLPYYPSLNILSDHPFAILRGNWVTPEQRTAAKTFRDFLLSKAAQRLAVKYGFRPTNPEVNINDPSIPENPFVNFKKITGMDVPATIPALVQMPNGDVVKALLEQWQKRY